MDFWDGFKPIYYFSRVFGLMPFSIRRGPYGNIEEPKVNGMDGLWCLFTTIVVYLSGALISHRYKPDSYKTIYLSILLDDFHLTMSLAFGALEIAMDMINRFKLFELWKCFIVFDKEVRIFQFYSISRLMYYFSRKVSAMEISFCYKSDHRRSWLCCTTAIAIIIVFAILTYCFLLPNTHLPQLRILFIMIVQNCVLIFVPISYITLLRALHQRYAALNSHLR